MLLAVSCTDKLEQLRPEAASTRLYASVETPVAEANGQTKVYADALLRVLWNADDRISVFNKLTYNKQYRFKGATGDNAGEFEYLPPDNVFTGNVLDYVYAVYPYQAGTTISNDGVITLTLPAEQSYKASSFGIGANTMVAVSEDLQVVFKNVGSYLSFKLYGEGVSVSRITLQGRNGEKLSGQATVTATLGGLPSLEMGAGASESVSLVCDPPVALNATANDFTEFWFVIPPTTFSQGFTVTVTDDQGGTFSKSISSSHTFSRNNLSRMAPLQVVPVAPVTPTKYLTFNSEGSTTLSLSNFGGNAPVLYYSTDGTSWTRWDYSELTFTSEAPLYLCGDNPEGFSSSTNVFSTFATSGSDFGISGDIMSLIDNDEAVTEIPCDWCFTNLFRNCAQLTTAPELPAPVLTEGCYSGMFKDCSHLSHVECLATDISATDCVDDWLSGISQEGTFVKADGVQWPSGADGIPNGWTAYAETVSATKYLTFTSEGTTTLSLTNYNGNAPLLYYSTDGIQWTPWDYSGLTFTSNAPLYLCGDNPNGFSSSYSKYSTFAATGSNFGISGDIMSLIDKDQDVTTIPIADCFSRLFKDCTMLTTAPELPATTLANNCYYELFHSCTSLTSAPELPATTLTYGCYYWMFSGCTSLTSAPELPATTLQGSCYSQMFSGCTSLTSAPELPATTLANSCYYWMFSGCTSLTSAPELPATTLANSCYYQMFSGCTSLTSAPELPATTLTEECYHSMFLGCTSLISAPVLPATTLANQCYYGMFTGCTHLNYVKCLATDISASDCLTWWLMDVAYPGTFVKADGVQWPSGPSGIPNGWTAYAESVSATKYLTFTSEGTTTLSLTNNGGNAPVLYYSTDGTSWTLWDYSELTFTSNAPLYICGDNPNGFSSSYSKLSCFAATGSNFGISGNLMSLINKDEDTSVIPSNYCFLGLFNECTLLTSAPQLSATTLAQGCYASMFYGCTGLTTTPELPATTLAAACYSAMFSDCTGLTTAPELPATALAVECYSKMFHGCTQLTTTPELPATTLANLCYDHMFSGCTGLTTAPVLPATTLAATCYARMFLGCTALTTAPVLPATTLEEGCYYQMFSGCTSLTTAPALPATTLTNYCYSNMFQSCTSLTTAPELPATTLTNNCYNGMFLGCTHLNYVKCLATDISATDCLKSWLYGVPSSGTFVKADGMQWPSGPSGIPNGWTVQIAE